MATPQDIRNIRLKNDYKEMQNIRGNVVSWRALKGRAPYIEEYELNINMKSIISIDRSGNPIFRNNHTVIIRLPPSYPMHSEPTITMTTSPYVFHPNWYANGSYCSGTLSSSESLGMFVVRMLRTLQYDHSVTNENSAANTSANQWYMARKNSGLFPCNTSSLPQPNKNRFEIKSRSTKKRFVIN